MLPHLYFIGFANKTLGKLLSYFEGFSFVIKLFPFKRTTEIKEWLRTLSKNDLADYYFLDCWELFEPAYRKIKSNIAPPNKSIQINFVDNEIVPLVKAFKRIIFNHEYLQLVFIPSRKIRGNKPAELKGNIDYAFKHEMCYNVFETEDQVYIDRIVDKIRNIKIVSPKILVKIFREINNNLEIEFLNNLTDEDLIEISPRLINDQGIMESFNSRTEQFCYILKFFEVYKRLNANISKVLKDKHGKLCVDYLKREELIKEWITFDFNRINSPFNFHFKKIEEKLFPDNSSEFIDFLKKLPHLLFDSTNKKVPDIEDNDADDIFG